MQLRKLIRILKDIEKDRGGYIEVNIAVNDFKNSPYDIHRINTVGIGHYFKEDEWGWLKDNETHGVVIGLESPSIKEYK